MKHTHLYHPCINGIFTCIYIYIVVVLMVNVVKCYYTWMLSAQICSTPLLVKKFVGSCCVCLDAYVDIVLCMWWLGSCKFYCNKLDLQISNVYNTVIQLNRQEGIDLGKLILRDQQMMLPAALTEDGGVSMFFSVGFHPLTGLRRGSWCWRLHPCKVYTLQ